MLPFTPQELERFHRDGFLLVPKLAEPEKVQEMLRVTDESVSREIPPIEYEAELGYPGAPASLNAAGGRTIRRLKQAIGRHPVFLEWAAHPAVLGRLRQILGPAIVLPLAHHNCIMVKDTRFSSDTGWHQDIRYWRFQKPELVSVLLALNSATRENGCLSVLPGTHRFDVELWRLDEAKFLRTDLPENRDLLASAASAEMEAGDTFFFDCRIFHSATRNRSKEARKSVIFTYRSAENTPVAGSRSASMPELLFS